MENPWFIKSPKNNNNFWGYLKNNSNSEGLMAELKLREIARLLGITEEEARAELNSALTKLANNAKLSSLSDTE